MTLREHNILVCLMEGRYMATILSILGLIAQLKGSGFFGSSTPQQSTYTVPGKFDHDYSVPDVGVHRNQL